MVINTQTAMLQQKRFTGAAWAARKQFGRVTRCSSIYDREKKGIFQLTPHVHVSIREAREAHTLTKRINDKDVCVSFGVDFEMADKYLDVVEMLEKMYLKQQNKYILSFFRIC